MGINLFVHSIQLVRSDWRNALRISGVLYLFCAIPSVLVMLLFPVPAEDSGGAAGALALPNLITAVLYVIAFLWLAVAWHRYVLLSDMPAGPIPEFNGRRMAAYFGYSLLIFVVLIGIAVVMAVAMFVASSLVGQLAIVVALAFYVVMAIVSYRLSPLLPAAALDQRMTLREAWAATSGATGAIIVLAIVSVLAAIAINLPAVLLGMLGGLGAFVALLWTLVTGWITMIVGISIVTTIYGHYVEGRALSTS